MATNSLLNEDDKKILAEKNEINDSYSFTKKYFTK